MDFKDIVYAYFFACRAFICREKNELSAYYHGVKLAAVHCHPDDTYDEEFGLHLLLRRACLKLKDEHTVVETVEELLQKA